jgi:ribonuclease VapC
MFVDATAIVDILNKEPEADTFAEAIEQHAGGLTSAIAVFEATLALCRIRHVTIEEAAADVHEFMSVCGGSTYAITAAETRTALAAFARYGKGRGHPARLNMGDCFAYAMARNLRVIAVQGRRLSQDGHRVRRLNVTRPPA